MGPAITEKRTIFLIMQKKPVNAQSRFYLPHIGQRIVKTTVAVFLCLIVYYLFGYRGADMPTEAAITAIICMQPYVRDTRDYAVNRFTGTLIGAFWGLAFLLLLMVFPSMGESLPLLYLRMALGVMLSLYTAVLVKKPETSGQAAIVFICVVISFPEIESPLRQALLRFAGVLLGTVTAIGVNVFRLPRDKERDCVFFVRISDLVPDRFSHLPSAARFRLNYLYDDGARICLMSEHAPAFFTLQMSDTMLSMPFIVMDGAAIFDANANRYLQAEMIDVWESARLREHLDALGLSYFIYTIHHNKVCIFHQGEPRPQEQAVYLRMKRSPYRSYLDGEIYEPEEIVYIKIIDERERITALEAQLQPYLADRKLRAVSRPQQVPGVSGLYFYADTASMPHAEARLMQILRETEPTLRPVEVFLPRPYHTEHDAMHLLHRLANLYEPLKIRRLFRKRDKKTPAE